jgi:hypothetical protein
MWAKAGAYAGSAWRGANSMWRGMPAAGRTAAMGAGIGGLYGAIADDTSVLGGAAMGAGIGLGGRYARAGFRAGTLPLNNRPFSAFGSAVGRRFARDFASVGAYAQKGATLAGNKAYNALPSSLKGWF